MNSYSIVFILIGLFSIGIDFRRAQQCQPLIDLVLIVDSSGSIPPADFDKAKTALVDIASRLNVGKDRAHVAVINFASHVEAFAQQDVFLSDLPTLTQRIQALDHFKTGTATGDALKLATEYCDMFCRPLNEGVPRIFAIFTDGQSNEGEPVLPAAANLRNVIQGTIFGIGIGNLGTTGQNELLGITDDPTTVLDINSYQQLMTVTNVISTLLCNTPAFILPSQRISLKLAGNETRYFRMKTLKNIGKNAIFEILVNNKVGDTVIFTSTVNRNPNSFRQKMTTQRNSGSKNLNVFVPSSANNFYFSVNGVDPKLNQLDFVVNVRPMNF